jgi:hypothetical protein
MKTEVKYLGAKTFCLGFPKEEAYLYNEIMNVMDLAREKKLPYRGSRRTSKNQVVKDLLALALAAKGSERAQAYTAKRGFELKEANDGTSTTID